MRRNGLKGMTGIFSYEKELMSRPRNSYFSMQPVGKQGAYNAMHLENIIAREKQMLMPERPYIPARQPVYKPKPRRQVMMRRPIVSSYRPIVSKKTADKFGRAAAYVGKETYKAGVSAGKVAVAKAIPIIQSVAKKGAEYIQEKLAAKKEKKESIYEKDEENLTEEDLEIAEEDTRRR